jgi:ATP-dependent DNA helicase RecG
VITQSELSALLADLESDRIERTRSTTDTDKFAQAICAFANDFPAHRQSGFLLIGVEKDGTPSGLTVTEKLLEQLGGLRSDGNIQPLPAITVSKLTRPGGDIAIVEVTPSDLPPVRYKGQVWIRTGPRKATASEHEERILSERRVASARTFDAYACREASVKDLSIALFEAYRREAISPETIDANHRSLEEQLAALRFLVLKHTCPTHAGLLLFGKNPRYFLPGAYVQFLKLPGTSLTDRPENEAEISGDLVSVLRELDTRIRSDLQRTPRPETILRERTFTPYPEQAIRELLMNAIMHRSYESNAPVRFYWFSDRIEIMSPGGLYGEATKENFPTRNSYRNPVIAEAMKELGYVNRYGYGVQRAQALLHENRNPPATFQFEPGTVLATMGAARP